MADSPIKIVQLSDPHLFSSETGTMYGLNTLDSFKQVLSVASSEACDVALLTGDIAQDESRETYQLVARTLGDLNAPVYMIPGNHDDVSLMEELFPIGQVSTQKQIVIGNWQIILLNSQVKGQVGGYLAEDELAFLEQCLTSHAADYALVCVHHHPVDVGCKWLDQIALDNSDALFAVLAAYPQVKALLWGHIHQVFEETRAGVRLMSCPSTSIQFRPKVDHFELDLLPPGYRWLELYGDGEVKSGIKRLAEIPGQIDPTSKGY